MATPPAAESTSATDAEVNRLYTAGVEAAKEERWEDARSLFFQAWSIRKHYQIAANLGRAELMLKRHRDAAEHLTYFVNNAPRGLSKDDVKKARELAQEATAKVGEIRISVDVGGADILVNGKLVGRSPLAEPIFVDAGDVVFEAQHGSHSPARTTLAVAPGTSHNIELKLAREPRSSGKANGILITAGLLATGALVGVGTVTAIWAVDKKREAEEVPVRFNMDLTGCQYTPDCLIKYNEERNHYSRVASASVWSFVGAGAVGAGTAVLHFMGSSPVQTSGFLGPGGGMLMFTGKF
ncbi:MAG: hypothetical protein HUU21_38815 [Polyangiaceae bacterium]|nr:hypothetical protein [Polyangiaceae bacterium]